MHGLQVLASSELARVVAEQDDLEPAGRKNACQHTRGVIQYADDTDDGSRQNGAPFGFIVQADIAAGDWHIERPAGFADAGDRLRELPHDVRSLWIAKVQAVGRRD